MVPHLDTGSCVGYRLHQIRFLVKPLVDVFWRWDPGLTRRLLGTDFTPLKELHSHVGQSRTSQQRGHTFAVRMKMSSFDSAL